MCNKSDKVRHPSSQQFTTSGTGLRKGAVAPIHSMHGMFDKDDTNTVLLIDA